MSGRSQFWSSFGCCWKAHNYALKKIEDKVCEITPKSSEIVTKEVDRRLNEISGDIDSVQ